MPSTDYLAHYAEHYNTVELNGVFYRMPEPEAVKHWYEVTPKNFIFAYKASRFITHIKKLMDPAAPLRLMLHRADLLKEKLGPILFQLPPGWSIDLARLKSFLQALPGGYRFVMEFRNSSWFTEQVYELLEKHRIALCLFDMKGVPSPIHFTGSLAYLRFHGSEQKYAGNYSLSALREWAAKIRRWRKQKRSAFVYFNNDLQGHALKNANELKSILKIR